MTQQRHCAACRQAPLRPCRSLRQGGRIWRCPLCRHVQLIDWEPRPDQDEFAGVDPRSYRRSMWPERSAAAREIVEGLREVGAEGPLLDVGCSFGWLVHAASAAGIRSYGVDPSRSAVEAAAAEGLSVRQGFFPEEDWGRQDWGIIAFLDVLEHIVDLDTLLEQTVSRLRPDGWLAIQLPVSSGVVYQTSSALERMSRGRVDGPLRRMLQLDFPYPHVHYFSRRSLSALLGRFGLVGARVSTHPIATGHLADRVAWRDRIRPSERIEAAGLAMLLSLGRISGRNDLIRVIARRKRPARAAAAPIGKAG